MAKLMDCKAVIEMDSRRIDAYQGSLKGCNSWLIHQWRYESAKRKILARVAEKYSLSKLRLMNSWRVFYGIDWFDPYL